MLLGLRTQEPQKVINSHQLILDAAKKQNKVFFEEAGDGHELITEDLWLEFVWGWLIPDEKVEEFNELYLNDYDKINSDEGEWWNYFLRAEWEETENGFEYQFVEYPDVFETE